MHWKFLYVCFYDATELSSLCDFEIFYKSSFYKLYEGWANIVVWVSENNFK